LAYTAIVRPYTGNRDRASGARAGTRRFVDWMVFLYGVRNLGIYANRKVNGPGTGWSVHATGRACDLGGNRDQLRHAIDFAYQHRDRLQVEAIHDYSGAWIPTKGFGAAYRCNRDTGGLLSGWQVYDSNKIGRGGSWTHIEISPTMADRPDMVDTTFTAILNELT
jgi:hypothetical protein